MIGNKQYVNKKRIAYPNQSYDVALEAPANQQLLISSVAAINGSAASNVVGIGHEITGNHWKLWTITGTVDEVTTAAQDGDSVELFSLTNNHGFLVQAKRPFDLISMNIAQEVTGSPVYSYQYWNGSTWASLNLLHTPAFNAQNKQAVAFVAPIDWAVGDGSLGADEELYSVRVRATTAPSQALQVQGFKVCELFDVREEVLPKAAVQIEFPGRQFLLQQDEGIVAFFAFPDADNTMELSYQVNP